MTGIDVRPGGDGGDKTGALLDAVTASFTEELGSAPTLGELLEILGWAIPANHSALAEVIPAPVRFDALLSGGKRYRDRRASRTGELNDHAFDQAADCMAAIIDVAGASSENGQVTIQLLAERLASALRAAHLPVADTAAAQIESIAVNAQKRAPKPKVGDLIAIPASTGGFHVVLVIARDRFGTALGLLEGVHHGPKPTAGYVARDRYIYTDDNAVASGTWRVIDHDETLTAAFPGEPEIFHRQDPRFPNLDLGEFGAAETAQGRLRKIGPDEQHAIGLHDGTYRQGYVSTQVAKLLDEFEN